MAQVNDYLIANRFNVSKVSKETLYVFWGGSNDIFAALSNQTLTATGVNDDLAALAIGIPLLLAFQVEKLVKAGAQHFFFMLLPTWSYTPVGRSLFVASQLDVLTQFTNVVNQGIMSNVTAAAGVAGASAKFFDVISFTQTILDNPGGFGLVDTTHPCLQNYEVFITGTGGQAPIVCSNPDQYLFWDGEHPTAKVHAVYASEVMRSIGWEG